MHRALEEVSKQKEAARQARGQRKDLGQGQRVEMARLEGQCQRLERQKVQYRETFRDIVTLLAEERRSVAGCSVAGAQ